MNPQTLCNRLKNFSLRLVPLCEALPKGRISYIIEDQLLRSGFSASANYRSACNAQSKKSFNAKLSIALEEIDGSCFWLEMIDELNLIKKEKRNLVISKGIELNIGCFETHQYGKIKNYK